MISSLFKNPSHRLLLLVSTCVFILLTLFAEKIPFNDGLGWDGVRYAEWARHSPFELFRAAHLRSDRVGRLAPIVLIHLLHRLFRIPFDNKHLVQSFAWLNCTLMILATAAWCRIRLHLNVSEKGLWIGAIALFLNHFCLKFVSYYPVLMDAASFTTSLFILEAWLSRKSTWLLICAFLGSFASPLALFNGALLIAFPANSFLEAKPHECQPPNRVVLWGTGAVLCTLFYGLAILGLQDPAVLENAQFFLSSTREKYLGLSLTISISFFFLGVVNLLYCKELFSYEKIRSLFNPKLFLAIAFFLIVNFIRKWIGSPLPDPNASALGNISQNLVTSVREPGEFLVAHISFIGPFLIFGLFLARQWREVLHQAGLGICLVALLAIPFCLCAESRCDVDFFALLLPFLVKATDALEWSTKQIGFLAVVSALCSKVWLKIGQNMDLYFMSTGAWMGPVHYEIQLMVVAILGAVFYQHFVASNSHREANG